MTETASEVGGFGKLLRPDQLSQLISVSVKSLANWRSRGFGPPFIKVGGRVMYAESRIMTWLQDNEAFSTSQAMIKNLRGG